MEVLIVSKTKMQHGVCIGAVSVENGSFFRLFDENGYHPSESTHLDTGQIWDITYKMPIDPRPLPHSEDICVISKKFKSYLDEETKMLDLLKSMNVPIYYGSIESLFESKLRFTESGTGYINEEAVPKNSVCFWVLDRDLNKKEFNFKTRYNYNNGSRRWGYTIAYVGIKKPVDKIPKGTLVRMSLAHWWAPDECEGEERCFLQLSGWYDLSPDTST